MIPNDTLSYNCILFTFHLYIENSHMHMFQLYNINSLLDLFNLYKVAKGPYANGK